MRREDEARRWIRSKVALLIPLWGTDWSQIGYKQNRFDRNSPKQAPSAVNSTSSQAESSSGWEVFPAPEGYVRPVLNMASNPKSNNG